jgi:hypothetical protein
MRPNAYFLQKTRVAPDLSFQLNCVIVNIPETVYSTVSVDLITKIDKKLFDGQQLSLE